MSSMLARSLSAIRRFSLEPGSRLGSWRLSVVLMVVLALDYLFLAIWSTSSPADIVQDIALLSPFWLVYILLLVNTGTCLWRRLPNLGRDLAAAPRWSTLTPDWEIQVPAATAESHGRRLLRHLGYRIAVSGQGRVAGVRWRWAALGTYLFHGAFFLLALGFLLTLLGRQEARLRVAEGEEFTGAPEQISSLSAPGVLASGIPEVSFKVENVYPEFWEDILLFTELRSDLTFPDGQQRRTRINQPIWLGGVTYLRLAGFGYTPRYELVDMKGRVLDTAFVKLNVFPPGQRDYFQPNRYPHRVYVEVLPDAAEEDGQALTRSLNLVNPACLVRVYRGRFDLGGDLLTRGERFSFEGMQLGFPEIRYWGEFSVVRDPGAPVVFAGFIIGLAGLILKIPGGRREAEWLATGDRELPRLRGWGGTAPLLPAGKAAAVATPPGVEAG